MAKQPLIGGQNACSVAYLAVYGLRSPPREYPQVCYQTVPSGS